MSLSGEVKKLTDAILTNGGVLVTGVVATAADLAITAASAKNIIMKLGANDTSKKLSIIDSDDAEVLKIDGNGLITTAAGLAGPVTGALTGNSTGTHTGNVAGVETITAKTATDMAIVADGDEDIILKMGDAAAANKIIFQDSAAATVATLDSNGVFDAVTSTAPMSYATTDTSGAPTNAECVSAFGAAADVGAGFIGVYQDSHASGVSYLCVSNGTDYDIFTGVAAA